MSTDDIAAFVLIAKLGSFRRAAETLHRSQPAISRRINMLEDRLRTKLFERVPGGVIVTEAGRAFLPYAEAVLANLKDGASIVRDLEKGAHGTVSLVLVGSLASTKLSTVLRQFRRTNPKVKMELRTATSQEVSDIVRRGEATFGLRYFTASDPGLVSQMIMEEPLVVACSVDHPFAGRLVRDIRRLEGDHWVAFPAQRGRQESFVSIQEQRLAVAGLDPRKMVRIDSLTAQKRFVEAGFGIALLMESSIEDELRQGTLKLIDVPALRTSVPVTLVRRRDGYVSGAARTLLTAIAGGWTGKRRRVARR